MNIADRIAQRIQTYAERDDEPVSMHEFHNICKRELVKYKPLTMASGSVKDKKKEVRDLLEEEFEFAGVVIFKDKSVLFMYDSSEGAKLSTIDLTQPQPQDAVATLALLLRAIGMARQADTFLKHFADQVGKNLAEQYPNRVH